MDLTPLSHGIAPQQASLTEKRVKSEQTLSAVPLDEKQRSAIDNAKPIASTTPAAIYHPSEELDQLDTPLVAYTTYIGRTSQSPEYPMAAARLSGATSTLKSAFEDFKASVAASHPELADKEFGFTLQADGKLKLIDSKGSLSAAQSQQLSQLLNGDDTLKDAAITYRESAIDVVHADAAWGGGYMGRYELNKDNFASSVDLGELFTAPFRSGMLANQLWAKGQLATAESEAARLAAQG